MQLRHARSSSRLPPCFGQSVRLTPLTIPSSYGPCTTLLRSLPVFRYIALATGAAARVPQLPPGGGGFPASSLRAGITMSSSTPSIRVYESHRYSLPHHHRPAHPSAAVAMAIPRAREEVPPPLPPPRHIEDLRAGRDPGWQWGNTNNDTGFGGTRLATVRPGSSLYGGSTSGYPRPREPATDYVLKGRESSVSRSFDDMSSENSAEHDDEDRSSKSRPSLGNHRYDCSLFQSLFLQQVAYDRK
jgi:hypothetical protein